MNVRTLKQEDNIRRIEFGEHIVGFRFGPFPNDQQIYRPFGGTSEAQRRKGSQMRDRDEANYVSTSSRQRINKSPATIPLDSDDDDLSIPHGNQQSPANKQQLKRQEERHMQFIKSYQGWLHDSHTDGYQSTRMISSLGFKRNKIAGQKSARADPDSNIYQLQNNQYKQSNIFPNRRINSVKKKHQRQERQSVKFTTNKYKGEGELKIKIIQNMIKSEIKPEVKRTPKPVTIIRAKSALLRTFSNPKILSIENRQLVRGTKICLQ